MPEPVPMLDRQRLQDFIAALMQQSSAPRISERNEAAMNRWSNPNELGMSERSQAMQGLLAMLAQLGEKPPMPADAIQAESQAPLSETPNLIDMLAILASQSSREKDGIGGWMRRDAISGYQDVAKGAK